MAKTAATTTKPIERELLIKEIVAGNNDRTVFVQSAIESLAESILTHGLLQPITVRAFSTPREDGAKYQIIAGERRYRAAKHLESTKIRARIIDVTDEEASALMLAENTARQDLDPIDEARAYEARIRAFGMTEAGVAKSAGVSVARVRSRIKLLGLCPTVLGLARSGQLPLGYGEVLADAKLTECRQLQAVQALNQQKQPNIGWWRTVISELVQSQTQGTMFDDETFMTLVVTTTAKGETLDPKTLPRVQKNAPPPQMPDDTRSALEYHRDFWRDAAQKWTAIGSWWIGQECECAAVALDYLIALIPSTGPATGLLAEMNQAA